MCDKCEIYVNREGVLVGNEQIFQNNREWHKAMVQQLSDFCQKIDDNKWDDDVIWDQLPAMSKIEQAYALSTRY